MVNYAFFLVLILQSLVLSRKFVTAFKQSQYLSNHLEKLVDLRTVELKESNMQLQNEITERKKVEVDLKEAQKKLVNEAHKAGMADIAISVLHNIGNIFNSIKTSSQLLLSSLDKSTLHHFKNANDIIRNESKNLDELIHSKDRIEILFNYYLTMEKQFDSEQEDLHENLLRIEERIVVIEKVIRAQLDYAGFEQLFEKCSLETVLEDTLLIRSDLDKLTTIQIVMEENTPAISVQKMKLVHILINLINNAITSMNELPVEKRIIMISLERDDAALLIKVKDNGEGILQENLKKIFAMGFSTKKDGLGFGLHNCANFMSEMHGEIWAESEGQNKGATFILKFPEESSASPI
jgi:C4-dicarboxylate-specific signal transduction histidine kinase